MDLPGAKERCCNLFLAGLSENMKRVLASDEAPTVKSLSKVGWNKRDWLHGVYAKILYPADPAKSSVAALYMGSATGVGGKGGVAKEFGLQGRRGTHLRDASIRYGLLLLVRRFVILLVTATSQGGSMPFTILG